MPVWMTWASGAVLVVAGLWVWRVDRRDGGPRVADARYRRDGRLVVLLGLLTLLAATVSQWPGTRAVVFVPFAVVLVTLLALVVRRALRRPGPGA